MDQNTYTNIQNDLSNLLKNVKYKENSKYKLLNQAERDAYTQAVLACKSIVSHYNPDKQ